MEILKAIGPPGSIGFLALCLFLAVLFAFVWPRSRRLAKHWLLWISGVYVVLGLPVVANAIVAALPAVPQAPPAELARVKALMIVDGDNRRGRLEEALRFIRGHPGVPFWVLGEAWLSEEIPSIPALGPGGEKADNAERS